MCIFLLINLVEMTYLTIGQLEYLVRFDQKFDNFDQNGQ
jgi:hypothetical protein